MRHSRYCLIFAGLLLLLAGIPAAAQELIAGKHYNLAKAVYPNANPDIGPVEPLGPDKAKGVVIWNHGRNTDRPAGDLTPVIGLYFAQRGWDVYMLYRYWHSDDRMRATQIVMAGVDRVKALGYKKVVLMGQSAGGFASLEAARYRDDIDTVVALAPAAFGDSGRGSEWRSNDYGLRPTIEALGGKATKVALAYFQDDEFYEAEYPHVRGPWAKETLSRLGVPHLVIDQPTFSTAVMGHNGGQMWEFAFRYGRCLILLVETGTAPPCDENDPATLVTMQLAPQERRMTTEPSPLLGMWYGTWSDGKMASLHVVRVADGIAYAKYRTSERPILAHTSRDRTLDQWMHLKITGQILRKDSPASYMQFRHEGDRLIGENVPTGGGKFRSASVIMRRAE